jgi:autoinducer 2-degrading protein
MIEIHVHVRVNPDQIDAFTAATLENAIASLEEPGVARFDVMQDVNDPARFVLVEAYRTADAPAAHKTTAHYLKWRDTVAAMMAAPRTSQTLSLVLPAS